MLEPLKNEYVPQNILIVEDNEDDIEALSRHIKKIWAGSRVVSVNVLQEVQSLPQKHHFDLVLLDLNLPDSNGTNTIRAFCDFNLGARLVILTGADVEEIAIEAKKLGASAVISKSRLLGTDFSDHLLERAFNIPSVAFSENSDSSDN